MKKEETITEHHSCASAEPTQVTATAACVPAHHRLYRTRLWQIVHAGVGIGCTCESCRGAEDESFTAPAADGSARVDAPAVLKEFVFVLRDYCRHETDLAERFRTLRVTRDGIATVARIRERHGAGKNVPASYLADMAIGAIDTELEIVAEDCEYRKRFANAPAPAPVGNPKPTLYLIPDHRKLGVMGMTEILTSVQLLGGIGSTTGKEPTTIAYAKATEQAFCFSYNDIYDRQIDLFKRKPYNLTKTLDALKAALVKEYRRRQAVKKRDTEAGK